MEETMVCCRCNKKLPLTEEYFYKDKSKKNGFNGTCKECKKIYNNENKEHLKEQKKLWDKNNKEYINEYQKKYLKDNKERLNKNHKLWRINNKIEVKICNSCGRELPATNEYFAKDEKAKDEFKSTCKDCLNKSAIIYRLSNIEAEKERSKHFRETHKEYLQEYSKQWREENQEYLKQYYSENKGHRQQWYIDNIERIREVSKQWRYNNKEHKREYSKRHREENPEYYIEKAKRQRENNPNYSKEYYWENKERLNQYHKDNKEHYIELGKKWRETHKEYLQEYRKNNKENIKLALQKRRTLKKGLEKTLTLDQWEQIKNEFNSKCAYCGKEEKLTIEHFIPLSKFGELSINNILPACQSCNSSKNAKSFFDWYPKYKYYSKQREKFILDYLNYKDGKQQLTIAM